MKVLLTGGCGYIGSSINESLRNLGHDVYIVDTNDGRRFQNLSDAVVRRHHAVIHLAASSTVAQCDADPELAIQNNIAGFSSIFDRLSDDQVFIYASTGSIYNGTYYYADENCHEFHPLSLYDITKFAGDQIAAIKNRPRTYGLRFGTVAGASPVMRWDSMINAMSMSACKNGFVDVYNTDAMRSVLCIQDLSQLVLSILEKKDARHGVYNVASFSETIGKIGSDVANYFDCDLDIHKETTKHYDFCMNCFSAQSEFGFQPTGTIRSICKSLEDILPLG